MSEEVIMDMQVNFRESFYEQNVTTVESHRELVLEQDYVAGAECISIVDINDNEVLIPEYKRSVILGIENSFRDTFPKGVTMADGNIPLNESNCYIQRDRMLDENLQIGNNFTISIPTSSGRLNRSLTIAGSFQSDLYVRRLTYDSEPFSYLYVITDRDALKTQFSDLQNSGDNRIIDRIWVSFDLGELVVGDPSNIVSSLRNIEKQLEQRILPDASVVDFNLVSVFYEYTTWATGMRIIALAFSIPSIIMGVMLIYYNSNLEADQQRRNVGTLKTRGATGSQATRWILSMSVFTGVIGSIGALLTGVLAAYLAGGVQELMTFNFAQMSNFSVVLLPSSIIIIFLFSFLAGLFIAIPSVLRAFLMSSADAHSVIERSDSAKTERMSNPVYQVALVGVSGVLLIPLIDGLESFADLSLGSTFLGITIVVLLSIFTIGLTFLLARPSARFKAAILLRIKKPSLSASSKVMGKTAIAFNRSEGIAVVFISLVFTAGMFSALAATTGNAHMKELFMFDVGADVVVDVKSGLENVTLDLIDDILQIDGVSQASGMIKVSTIITFQQDYDGRLYPFNFTRTVYGIQPAEWAKSVFLRPYFTYFDDPTTSINSLEDSNYRALANFKPVLGYTSDSFGNSYPIVSDEVSIEFLGPEEKYIMNCTIIDVMASRIAGFNRGNYGYQGFHADTYLPGEDINDVFVMVDIDNIHQALNISYVNKFYVALVAGVNYTRVMEDIGKIAPWSFSEIRSPFSEIDAVLESRAGQAIYGAYTLNVLFSVLYLTAGVILVATMKIRSMRKHFSLLRALGTQPPSIVKVVLIDSTIGVILGAIVGSIVGILLTYIILRVPLTYLGLSTSVTWEGLPLVISVPIPLIIGIVSIAIIFSLLATYGVTRRGLQSNIANDIQHSE
ncbi:MAG: ABC transporter permease [Candidatus Thorarchaeota archaeon]|nr:MAG: ABC transporter permease [Candidatus Thorarchaeota archaeon]